LNSKLEEMGGDQHCRTGRSKLSNDVHGRLDAQWVDAVEWFVEEKNFWFVKCREEYRHASAHAVGEARGDAIRHAEEVEAIKQVLCSLLPPVTH
jgi:hypothetical protein